MTLTLVCSLVSFLYSRNNDAFLVVVHEIEERANSYAIKVVLDFLDSCRSRFVPKTNDAFIDGVVDVYMEPV